MSVSPEINLALHERQGEAFLSLATEILYGGAAGGGKSHLMRVAAVTWAAQIPGLQVYLFRRISDDLIKNHIEGPKGLRAMLAPWVENKLAEIIEGEIKFWNGSKIYLCHCKDEKDRFKYLGAEIHLLLVDELTTFTDTIYRFLRSRVRAVGLNLDEKYRGRFPRIICSSNPGNIGHQWVKAAFIENVTPMVTRAMGDSEGGMLRQFIPAKLADNPSMAQDDPNYRQRLRGLGSSQLVRAMEDGDWDVIEGAFFDCWSARRHVIRPFEIPDTWMRFRSGDWGSAKPFSFGWWAVVSDDHRTEEGLTLPRGAIVRYREWYGCKRNPDGTVQANTGLKMVAEAVGLGLAERESEEITYGVLDPAAFSQDGGPSIHERMCEGSKRMVIFRRADNARVAQKGALGGWDQMRSRLIGQAEDRPMLVCFSTCHDSVRTIPVLQHDPDRPEDLNTDGEDHAGDDWRYACMSRPWANDRQEQSKPKFDTDLTIGEIITRNAQRRRESA